DEKPEVLHKELQEASRKNGVKWIVKKPHNWAGGISLETGRNPSAPKRACTFPWYSLTILWDGLTVTCPQDFFGNNIVGDISGESLREIWNGKSMLEYRNRMKTGTFSDIKTCAACDRPERKHFLGLPTSHLMGFIRESF
ncbi:MAG: SPASM domain-containing protein, partial [Thermodesulfobacteriota bacterium]